jgi:hypothetical protein
MQLWRMAVWERKGEASGCNERRSEERSGRLFLEIGELGKRWYVFLVVSLGVRGEAWSNARVFPLRLVTGRAVVEGFERERERD